MLRDLIKEQTTCKNRQIIQADKWKLRKNQQEVQQNKNTEVKKKIAFDRVNSSHVQKNQ